MACWAVGSTRHELCEQRLDFEEIVGTYTPDPHRELLQRVRVPEVNFFSESLLLPVYCRRYPVLGHRVLALRAVC